MTSLAISPRSGQQDEAPASPERSHRGVLEHVAMAAVLAFWALPFTHAIGGRGVHAELLFVLVLIPLVVLMQVWRAPTGSLVMVAVTAVAALGVCVFSPTGWWGSDVAASYVLAGAVFVAARRYVRTDDRRALVAAAISLAGVAQFLHAFLTWTNGRNPAAVMSGTFYWHNPYAAFLLPGAVIGLGFVAANQAPWRFVGWLSVPTCTAGIVLSSSRATLAALIVADLIMLAASFRSRPAVSRVVAALLLAAGITLALPGPPLFDHYSSPFAATDARAATGQSLAQNGEFRTEFWREAVAVARDRPATGGGFHSMASASVFSTPIGWARSQLAHDGYLQPLSDGGLLLGVPFLLGVLMVLWWALRRLWVTVRRKTPVDLFATGLTVAVLGALAHSAVDFDWSHPAILVEFALMAACLAPAAVTGRRFRRTHVVSAVSTILVIGSLAVCVPALHQWQIDQPLRASSSTALLDDASARFGDYRPAAFFLSEVLAGTRHGSRSQIAQALALTRREATIDVHLALVRDAAAAQADLDPAAVARANSLLAGLDGSAAAYIPDLAEVYLAAERAPEAAHLLSADIASQVRAGAPSPQLGAELALWAARLGLGEGYACEIKAVSGLGVTSLLASLPPPGVFCPSGSHQGSV